MIRPIVIKSLEEALAQGPTRASDLARRLGVSQPVLSRALSALRQAGSVVQMGITRGARYALARPIPDIGARWPLFQIDTEGRARELGVLHALEPHHYYLEQGPERLHGLFERIPYALLDARPAGFLGRAAPHRFPELGLPQRINDWTDDHFLAYLTQRSADNIGDPVLGEPSLDAHLSGSNALECINLSDRAARYPAYAAAAMAGSPAGSSAQGEQPKFLVRLAASGRMAHVLVKFSPPHDSEAGRRWADLLRCEFLAHQLLSQAGIAACQAHLFEFADRTYLEVERFDRIGGEGRRGVVSLFALDVARYGKLDRWSECARRLHRDGLLAAGDTERIALVEAFAMLIANTDRHFGNLMLFDRYTGPFELAPVYDMLPMLFAPHHEQVTERAYVPPAPTAALLRVWPAARDLAERYWQQLAEDAALSEPFQQLCAVALQTLRGAPQRTFAAGDA